MDRKAHGSCWKCSLMRPVYLWEAQACGVRPLNQRATRAQGLVLIHGLAGKTRRKDGWPGQAPPRGPAMADWSFSYLCRGSSNGWCDGVHIFVDNLLPPHQQPPSPPLLHRHILMLFQFFYFLSVPLTMVLPVPYYRRWMIECGAGSPCVHSRHRSPVLKQLILFFISSCIHLLSFLLWLLYGIRSTGATQNAIDARRKGEDSKVFAL